jgi:hypothetical protein
LRKIKLLQVGTTQLSEGYTAYSAGIYFKKVSLTDAERAVSPITTIFSGTYQDDLPNEPIEITGVLFNFEQLQEVGSIAELYLQDGSFYFDSVNQLNYIAVSGYRNIIQGDIIQIGEAIGFISEAQPVEIEGKKYPLDTFLNNVFFEPRLNDISIVDAVGNQQEGLFVYDDLDVSIANADGNFDTLRLDITGNVAEILIADIADSPEEAIETGFEYKTVAEFSDFRVVRKSIVEDVDYSTPNEPTISAIDERANWTQTINSNLLTQTEFTGLPDKFNNKLKPILMGTVNGAKGIPLRADGSAASFDYFIHDVTYGNIQSISQVYFKGEISGVKEDRFLTGVEYSVNLTTGIITVLNVNKGDVWAYGVFTTLLEPVEIILYLLETFENIAYLDSNFNKASFEAIRALNYTTHVYIDEKGSVLSDVIQKLCSDIQVDMLQVGGVQKLLQSNVIGTVSEEIPTYQILDNPPPWNTNRVDTVKTISVGYNNDYRLSIAETYFNNDEETTAVLNNRKAVDKTFETNLTLEADVQAIYDVYYDRYIQTLRTLTINRAVPFTSEVGDFISLPVVRKSIEKGSDYWYTEEEKAITTGELKTITTGEQKILRARTQKNIAVPVEKEIFADAIYRITSIDHIENVVECVFFQEV